jgi:hypothetical protein
MARFAGVVVLLALLPAFAWADVAAPLPPQRPRAAMVGALSRAQVAQIIADRGYFEMDGLRQDSSGNWRCTALSGPGHRVTLTVDPYGNITEETPLHLGGQ